MYWEAIYILLQFSNFVQQKCNDICSHQMRFLGYKYMKNNLKCACNQGSTGK